jgi:N-acetylglucosaminyldiphosphoundecaprenol N-acetyl-beta-D-mannosaminyltransferase
MTRWASGLDAPVLWCVGALFEYYSASRARAPRWVRRAGLEWLFRLVLEPRRLWGRYVIGNLLFLWRVIKGACRIA